MIDDDPVKRQVFAGLTPGDAANASGLPRRTVDRHWAFAGAWRERLERVTVE